ncbi:peptidylprolyl isomerase [Alkaliphilus peptidifermentans]|uniref:Peptidyl-prolyl cis-trans isomerase C n=1 Tax=Alkaliphilus peptidifermentans DSM 18978 TaxID=1120976 RepID=A0A1G5FK03_9FIRM|nr:peptidylprolyl isomerase [Alkaliphilus peptidifermentans]SCY38938.1 peptidyl-prolyl cis-trans isomerase C [Alkaliphilus peptidifermentans DSM 18978]
MKNDILAVVGNKNITQSDVDSVLKNIDPQQAMQFYSEEGKKKLLQELISQELLYLDAIDNNLQEDADFLNEVERVKTNLLKQYAISKSIANISVSEEEALNYYNENSASFKSPESINASHILVETEAAADEIISEIQNGLKFEEAAQKYSKCPSKEKGGELGHFTKGKMVPEFEAAVFNMDVNDLSAPVKTQFGFHIIKVLDKKPEAIHSFDEIKNHLTQQILSQKQQEVFYAKVESLKEKYPVTMNI